MKSTVVEVECISKKHSHQWGQTANPLEHEIEFAVPYDQNSVFFKMSGGTNFTLKTINQEAAEMFVVGSKFKMEISPVEAN